MAYERIPGGAGAIDPLKDEDLLQHFKFGIGKSGKAAGQDINMFRSGTDVSNIPGFKFLLQQIKANQGTQDMIRNRDLASNLTFAGQPGLQAGIQAEQQRAADQDTQGAIAGAAVGSYDKALDTFQSARNAQNETAARAAETRRQQLQGYGDLYNDQFKQKAPGFLKQLALTATGAVLGNAGVGAKVACDERLKENIVEFKEGLSAVERMDVKEFDYKDNAPEELKGKHYLGVMAQQLQEINPIFVAKLEEDKEFNIPEMLVVDTNALLFTAINAIKELSAKVKQLEGELNETRSKTNYKNNANILNGFSDHDDMGNNSTDIRPDSNAT